MEFSVVDERASASSGTPAGSLPSDVAESELRVVYQRGVGLHFARDLVGAAQAYDEILAHAILRPTVLAAAVEDVVDAFADGLTSLRARLHLRLLATKNRGAVEEEMANETAQVASVESGVITPARATMARALRFYTDAIEVAAHLEHLSTKLRRLQHEEGLHTAAAGVGVSNTGASEGGNNDVDLWMRVARTAHRLHKYTLERHALETAFQLQPDNFTVIDQLLYLLYALSDLLMLLPLLSHVLRLDPWHLPSLVLRRRLAQLGLPQSDTVDTEEFAVLTQMLDEQVEPEQVAKVERQLDEARAEYANDAADTLSANADTTDPSTHGTTPSKLHSSQVNS